MISWIPSRWRASERKASLWLTVILLIVSGEYGRQEGVGIEVPFVELLGLIIPIGVLSGWRMATSYRQALIVLEIQIASIFTASNAMEFYIMFEAVLLPMLSIMSLGKRARKWKAVNRLVIYTVLISSPMLVSIIAMRAITGTLEMWQWGEIIEYRGLRQTTERLIWIGLALGFMVKIPVYPFHVWLGEAHVEAPTGGSVILASLLLKLGTYGMLRLVVGTMSRRVTAEYTPLMQTLGMISLVYSSMVALRQTDTKRILGYGSIGHMNITVMSIMTETVEGIEGGVLQMICHGIVSGGLFIGVGALYERAGTREVRGYSGVVTKMPVLATIMLVFTLSNIGLPGTASFVGEILCITGIYEAYGELVIAPCICLVTVGGYSLWMYNRVMYGVVTRKTSEMRDIGYRELSMLGPLTYLTLYLGVSPKHIVSQIEDNIEHMVG